MKIGVSTPIDRLSAPKTTVGSGKSSQPAVEQSAGLEPGSLLKGKVVGRLAGGELIVETRAGNITAKSLIYLETGKEFWFEVVKGGQDPLLSAAVKKDAALEIIRLLVPAMRAFGDLSSSLPGMAASVPASELSPEAVKFLQNLATALVGSDPDPVRLIKFLSLLNHGPPQDAVGHKDLAALFEKISLPGLQKLVKLLEAHSSLNSQPSPTSQSQENYLLFPCCFAGESGWGEWLFSFEQEEQAAGQENSSAYNLSFYLSMSRLGDLLIQFHQQDKNLDGTFSLATPEAARHVQENLPQLQPVLEQLYQRVSLSCRCARQSALQQLKKDLSLKAGMESFALLDVRA